MAARRLNKTNRPQISRYIIRQFGRIANRKAGTIRLIDIWDTCSSVRKRFNISHSASRAIVWQVINERELLTCKYAWEYSVAGMIFNSGKGEQE